MERSLTTPAEVSELTELYDIYGELLNDKQRTIFEDYFIEDYSLAEVAEECDITRQGVYDTLNRIRKKLRSYENCMRIRERTGAIEERLGGMEQTLRIVREGGVISDDEIDELQNRVNEIRELL